MPAWRRFLFSAFAFLLLAACSDEDGPEPVGIMWGSGASGAFVGDTISLVAFYRDAAGDPIGLPRPSVTWTSSLPSVVSIVSDSLALAVDTGQAIMTAVTSGGRSHSVQVPFKVIPPWEGRLVWPRLVVGGSDRSLAVRELPGHEVREVPEFGYPGQSKGDPYLTSDGSRVAAIAPRASSPTANRTIFNVDLIDGPVRSPFDSLPGNQFAPVWMPGDTQIAFLMEAASGYEVFTANPDGSGVLQRTTLGQRVPPFFDITPDNTLILPLRTPAGDEGDLYEITLGGDTVRRLTSPAGSEAGVPSASPDGSMIAFSSGAEVWLMNRNGTNPRRLLPPRRTLARASGPAQFALSGAPSWTPDSRFVLIHWAVDPLLAPDGHVVNIDSEIYAVRVADSLAIRLTRSPQSDVQPVFR